MKVSNLIYRSLLLAGTTVLFFSCTKLDQNVYSVVPNQNFWKTPEQIAAGIAPAPDGFAVSSYDGNFLSAQSDVAWDQHIVRIAQQASVR